KYEFSYITLHDDLKLSIDIDALRKENTLQGHFVDHLMTQYEATTDATTKEDLMRAVRLGLEAFEGEILYHVD
ncbi:MAG TPA: hypothetical protein GX717_09435, partial [Clostridiaceae bacterium]|nr:hypothetical protein [Clostridiaceae bacterium]